MRAKAKVQPVREDEFPDDLPEGWAIARLDDVANTRLGKMLDAAKNVGSPTPYLRNVNVRWLAFDLDDLFSMRATKEDKEELDVRNGDLFVCEGGEPGRCAVWTLGPTDIIFQKAIHRIRLSCGVSPTWLALSMKNDAESGRLEEHFTGSGIEHLTGRSLARLHFPLPPIDEQERIVAKIEELLKNINASRDRLAEVPKILKAFRQSVLAAACSGRLTEDWREEHPDVESAATFLASRPRGTRAAAHRHNAEDQEIEKNLPGTWVSCSFDQLFSVQTGATPLRKNPAYYTKGTVPWVKTGEVHNCEILQADEFISKLALKETNAKLFPAGTILIAMYGEGKTRGQVGRLRIDAATNQACAALVNPDLRSDTQDYVFYYCLGQYEKLRGKAFGGNQPNLSLGVIKAWTVNLPPFEEQTEIVRRVEILFKLADKIEKRVEAATKRADKLTQAILAKAFRGELVPTEAELARQEGRDYEPASKLLERIKSEREASAASKDGAGRRRRRSKAGKK